LVLILKLTIDSLSIGFRKAVMLFDALALLVMPVLPVTKKTRSNYQGSYDRYLAPTLGHKDILLITADDVLLAIKDAPPQSAYQALMVGKSLMREAKSRNLITTVVTDSCKLPTITVGQTRFLTWDQLADVNLGKYSEQIKFLALHGLRWGEAVALRQEDIYDGLVHINKSVHGATKTKAGVRVVPYVGHFKKFPKTRKPLAKILNANGVNIHSLRKTYAYVLKSNGVHVTTAQRLMGHASPMVTLGIYTAVLDDEIISTGKILIDKYMK
jgi:integrase